jgi:segregation and condensation protein B
MYSVDNKLTKCHNIWVYKQREDFSVMENSEIKSIIESILFASGKAVNIETISKILEINDEYTKSILNQLKNELEDDNRGIRLIKLNDSYQLVTRPEYYEYICELLDNRNKPNLSQAALETIAIIAYNPKITRAEIENIRGVNSDGVIYKLLDYNLIQEAGRLDVPGRPTTYEITEEFLRMFGYSSLNELPELPRYKLDENEQIVIEEIIEKVEEDINE